jgi:hypothetical protein
MKLLSLFSGRSRNRRLFAKPRPPLWTRRRSLLRLEALESRLTPTTTFTSLDTFSGASTSDAAVNSGGTSVFTASGIVVFNQSGPPPMSQLSDTGTDVHLSTGPVDQGVNDPSQAADTRVATLTLDAAQALTVHASTFGGQFSFSADDGTAADLLLSYPNLSSATPLVLTSSTLTVHYSSDLATAALPVTLTINGTTVGLPQLMQGNAPSGTALNFDTTAFVGHLINSVTLSFPGGANVSADYALQDITATFSTVDAKISIVPSAVNEVGATHTFTVTVLEDLGSGFVPAPGASVSVTLTGSNGAVPNPAGPITGTTDTSGQFLATFTSATAGLVTGHATADITLDPGPPPVVLHRETDGAAGNSGDAVKRFVDANISITPATATNGITQPHTFTVTVLQNDGLGGGFSPAVGAPVTVTLTNSNGALANPPGPFPGVTDANGQCFVTFTSVTAGTVTGHASTDVSFARQASEQPPSTPLVVHRETDGTHGSSNDAVKTFGAGQLCWLKENSDDGSLVGGATFQVTGPNGFSVTVVDNQPPDADPADGKFQLNDLVLGTYSILETAPPPGFTIDNPGPQTVTLTVDNPSNCDNTPGDVVPVFTDTPVVQNLMFRMTGGGSIFLPAGAIPGEGVRVTHGFELHCTPSPEANNHLEINWGKSNNHFHLLSLDVVTCDKIGNPAPPPATADLGNRMIGVGTGRFSGTFNGTRYQNVSATVSFTLTDFGEPGTSDTAKYLITLNDGTGTVVLDTVTDINLTFGNHQVHPELKNLTPAAANVQQQIDKTFNFLNNQNLSDQRVNMLTQDLLGQFAAFEAAQNGATISGTAFLDANRNGIQDFGEGGLAGIVVQLFNSKGQKVAQTKTDSDGNYSFNAPVGTYKLVFVLPSNRYHFSAPFQGGDPTVDSDVDATGQTALFSVLAGQIDPFLSAGLYFS